MITSKEVSGMCYSLALIVCFVIARSGSDEAIQLACVAMDCFASLAMTASILLHYTIIITGFSISILNAPISSAPSAPSTAR